MPARQGADALREHAEQVRQARRRRADQAFPTSARTAMLVQLARGSSLETAAKKAGVTSQQALSRARWDRTWRRDLDLVLTLTRDESQSHGTEYGYRDNRCRCPDCRMWNAGRARAERGGRPPASRADTSWHEPFLEALTRSGKIAPAAALVGKMHSQISQHSALAPPFAAAVDLAIVRAKARQMRPLLDALRRGATLDAACKKLGIHRGTITDRREDRPYIDALIADAVVAGGRRIRREVRDRLAAVTVEAEA